MQVPSSYMPTMRGEWIPWSPRHGALPCPEHVDGTVQNMRLPQLAAGAIERAIPTVRDVALPLHGGQKLVFPCTIGGARYALKVVLADSRKVQGASGAAADVVAMEAEARARREFAILSRCHNPHLATPGPIGFSVAEIEGQRVVYFTEEWVEGQDLRTALREAGPLGFDEIVRLGLDIAEAIDALWAEHLIHRDVKPGNIMWRASSGAFLLMDLGSALDLLDAKSSGARTPGTRIYFSPERVAVARRRPLDLRSDLFSLGIVLYEATTGVHPFAFPTADDADILARIQHVQPLRPSSFRSHVPLRLSTVIMRLLAKTPSRRFQAGAQVAEALRGA